MLSEPDSDISKLFEEISGVIQMSSVREALKEIVFGKNNHFFYQYYRNRLDVFVRNYNCILNRISQLKDSHSTKYFNVLIQASNQPVMEEINLLREELTKRLSGYNDFDYALNVVEQYSEIEFGEIRGFQWTGKNFENQIIALHLFLEDAGFIEKDKFMDFFNAFSESDLKIR